MKKTNYYKENDEMSWIASRVFDEEIHYGGAITNEELEKRNELEQEYANQIALAKLMLKENPEFNKLSYESKINTAANLILELKKKELEKKHSIHRW